MFIFKKRQNFSQPLFHNVTQQKQKHKMQKLKKKKYF